MEDSLYEQIGGEPALDATVKKLYQLILEDPLLSPYFKNSDMIKQHRLQKKFLTYALKGHSIPEFAKKSMQKAHASLNLENKHFDKIKELLDQSMTFLKVESDLIVQVLNAVEQLRGDVLYTEQKLTEDLYRKVSVRSESSLSTGSTSNDGSLLEALGGEEAIDVVVKKLYELLLKDSYLAPYFEKTDMKRQHIMQKKFLSLVVGGKKIPVASKRAMFKAHKKLSLDDTDFDRVKKVLGEALQAVGVDEYLTEKVLAATEVARELVLCRETLGENDEPPILDLMGGEEVVEKMVKTMYINILKDELLSPYFEKVDLTKQKKMVKKFFVLAFSGDEIPQSLKNTVWKAHAKLGLDDADFDKFKIIIRDSLESIAVPKYIIDRAGAVVEKSRNFVLGKDREETRQTHLDV
ncbi:hypothetical protein HDV06_001680 [Boothiomyces sp. JEL0866]|nr:hypothetical protein HDV06_001680 [Boothiomyces sp. JEL0866]